MRRKALRMQELRDGEVQAEIFQMNYGLTFRHHELDVREGIDEEKVDNMYDDVEYSIYRGSQPSRTCGPVILVAVGLPALLCMRVVMRVVDAPLTFVRRPLMPACLRLLHPSSRAEDFGIAQASVANGRVRVAPIRRGWHRKEAEEAQTMLQVLPQ